jgi:D-alanine-D-alanine ligase
MNKERVAILYGGRSGEHEVSLNSGASVYRNLDREKYEPVLIGIAKDGSWYLQPPEIAEAAREPDAALEVAVTPENLVSVTPSSGFALNGRPLEVDLVFPVLHGSFGEDGTVQGLLEVAGLPYVGAGVLGSSLGMDKQRVKEIWERQGLPVLPFIGFDRREQERVAARELVAPLLEEREYPLFVKPARAGSSVGITKVNSPEELEAAVEEALVWDTRVILEPGIDAREIEVAVLGDEEPTVFDPGEVVVRSEFYSYEAKYLDPGGAELRIPADLPPLLRERIMEIARKAFISADCYGFARIDLFVQRESGEVYLNEINTIPGFTRISMFPKMVAAGGLPYPELLERLMELAKKRRREREALRYEFR